MPMNFQRGGPSGWIDPVGAVGARCLTRGCPFKHLVRFVEVSGTFHLPTFTQLMFMNYLQTIRGTYFGNNEDWSRWWLGGSIGGLADCLKKYGDFFDDCAVFAEHEVARWLTADRLNTPLTLSPPSTTLYGIREQKPTKPPDTRTSGGNNSWFGKHGDFVTEWGAHEIAGMYMRILGPGDSVDL